MDATLAGGIEQRIISGTDNVLISYLISSMGDLAEEHLRVLFLDHGNRLIRDEIVSEGTTNSVTVPVKRMLRRALELHSARIILAHNHPSGSPTPSPRDISATLGLQSAGRAIGIELIDHIIVAGTKWCSFHRAGLLG